MTIQHSLRQPSEVLLFRSLFSMMRRAEIGPWVARAAGG